MSRPACRRLHACPHVPSVGPHLLVTEKSCDPQQSFRRQTGAPSAFVWKSSCNGRRSFRLISAPLLRAIEARMRSRRLHSSLDGKATRAMRREEVEQHINALDLGERVIDHLAILVGMRARRDSRAATQACQRRLPGGCDRAAPLPGRYRYAEDDDIETHSRHSPEDSQPAARMDDGR